MSTSSTEHAAHSPKQVQNPSVGGHSHLGVRIFFSGADAVADGTGAGADALGLIRGGAEGGTVAEGTGCDALGTAAASCTGRGLGASGCTDAATGDGATAGSFGSRAFLTSTIPHAPAAASTAASASPATHRRSTLREVARWSLFNIAASALSAKSAGGSCAGHEFKSRVVIYASRTSSSRARSRSRARNSLVLTVFSGTPSASAISAMLRPWNSASTNTMR